MAEGAALVFQASGGIVYTAPPGTSSVVHFAGTRVQETNIPLRAGFGCQPDSDDATVIECKDWVRGREIHLGDGDDRLTQEHSIFAVSVVLGGAGDDVLEGTAQVDRISGGPGADRIDGADAPWEPADEWSWPEDRLFGDAGDDELVAGDGRSALCGDTGDSPSVVTAYCRDEVADGNRVVESGDDTLRGGVGRAVMIAGDGQDELFGGRGQDGLRGGSGRGHSPR
jgi:Ca2+-binding RTX toxin-like protein